MTLVTWLFVASVRTLMFASVVGIAVWVLRVKRPGTMLAAWTLVLYVALAMPLLAAVLPSIAVPIPITSTTPPALGTTMADSDVNRATTNASPATFDARAISGPTIVAMLLIYGAGVVWLGGRALAGWVLSRRLDAGARVIDEPEPLAQLHSHAMRLGLRRPPRLLESSALNVPATSGVMRPSVILPATWREWSTPAMDAVLAHELSHVGRRDTLTQRLSLVYRALAWPNPLSWWLHRRLAVLAEQASDDAALDAGIEATTYAEVLLGFFAARRDRSMRDAWHVAMARGAGAIAEQRVERILTWQRSRPMTLTSSVVLGIVFVAAPVVGVAASIDLAPFVVSEPAVSPVDRPQVVVLLPLKALSPTATLEAARAMDVVSPRERAVDTPWIDQSARVYTVDTPGLTAPVVVHRVDPKYTPGALRAKIHGDVEVEVVLSTDGTVAEARVVKSLDTTYGLDQEALAAAKAWTFTPAMLDGKAVKVRMMLTMEFRLH